MGNIKFFSLDQNFDNVTCCIPSFDFRAPSAQACIVSALSSPRPFRLEFLILLGAAGFAKTYFVKIGSFLMRSDKGYVLWYMSFILS